MRPHPGFQSAEFWNGYWRRMPIPNQTDWRAWDDYQRGLRYRLDEEDAAIRDRDEHKPVGAFRRNPKETAVAAEIDIVGTAGDAHARPNAHPPRIDNRHRVGGRAGDGSEAPVGARGGAVGAGGNAHS